MSEFSDRALVAGDVVGTRAFRVDSLGRLTGVTHREVFKPGVNDALCVKDTVDPSAQMYAVQIQVERALRNTGQPGMTRPSSPEHRTNTKAEHVVSGLDCKCGFYAYTDGKCDYGDAYPGETVRGIIRGTGVCTVGTRGFRASKAELVALVIPGAEGEKRPERSRWERFCMWSDRRGPALMGLAVGLAVTAVGLAAGAADLRSGWLAAAGVVAGIVAVVLGRALLRGIELNYEPSVDTFTFMTVSEPSRDVLAKVRHNYPDVPVYPTLKAAREAHPLSEPPPVTPETCDDFWTREDAR